LHTPQNTYITNIHNTQRHEIYKEAVTCILNVVYTNKVNVFKAMCYLINNNNYILKYLLLLIS